MKTKLSLLSLLLVALILGALGGAQSARADERGVTLFEGWNLVDDWPGPPANNARNLISTLNASLNADWAAAAKYDAAAGAWRQTFAEAPLPAFNTLTDLAIGDDFWLYLLAEGTLTTVPWGSISGALSYPSAGIPPLAVVAFSTTSSDYWYIETALNQTSYLLGGLPPGTYRVVAYVQAAMPDFPGGYSAAVPCGLLVTCIDHTLLDVSVTAGVTTLGINPGDWYAGPGAFPVKPADVP